MKRKKILISCNMEIQHFFFVKSFVDKYKDTCDIKVVFQSHLTKKTLLSRSILFIKKNGLINFLKKIICRNIYSKMMQFEKMDYYNKHYPDIKLKDLYNTIGKENILITVNINSEKDIDNIKNYNPDLFLLQGGKLLKNNLLNVLKNTIMLHLHLGLVPYYRGGNSQFWSIYNNRINENGFTIQSVDLGIDTGGIYIRKSIVNFNKEDTQHSMFYKTQIKGIEAIKNLIDFYIKNKSLPSPIIVTELGVNYSGKMMTSSANEYVYKNRKRIFSNYETSDNVLIYKDISVI